MAQVAIQTCLAGALTARTLSLVLVLIVIWLQCAVEGIGRAHQTLRAVTLHHLHVAVFKLQISVQATLYFVKVL